MTAIGARIQQTYNKCKHIAFRGRWTNAIVCSKAERIRSGHTRKKNATTSWFDTMHYFVRSLSPLCRFSALVVELVPIVHSPYTCHNFVASSSTRVNVTRAPLSNVYLCCYCWPLHSCFTHTHAHAHAHTHTHPIRTHTLTYHSFRFGLVTKKNNKCSNSGTTDRCKYKYAFIFFDWAFYFVVRLFGLVWFSTFF